MLFYKPLRDVLAKGPKYREPRLINWKYDFKLLMDVVEDYARKWTKREKRTIGYTFGMG